MAAILDQSQTISDTNYSITKTSPPYWAQTFKVGITGALNRVVLKGRKYADSLEYLVVEIRTTSLSGGYLKPTTTVLATKSIAWTNLPATEQEFNIDFTSPPNVETGTTYAIVVYAQSSTNGEFYILIKASSNVYADGIAWRSGDGTTWIGATGWPDYILGDFYFKTYVLQNTIWEDINCDIRCNQRVISDINADIRCVSEHPVLRDINCDVRCLSRTMSDINCDIRCIDAHPVIYDINSDIRCSSRVFSDINCDIRCVSGGVNNLLSDIDCDIRCVSRTISNINCDIRCNSGIVFNDINCDIRCRKLIPAGRDTIRLKVGGNYLNDVDTNSIKYNFTSNESSGLASFRLVRYSDDFNRTLSASSSPLTNDSVVEIYFDSTLVWYGYILGIEPTLNNEEVIVQCVDRKYKIQDTTLSISYGRDGDYDNTGKALKYVLDLLVTDGSIVSYTGLISGIVPEFQQSESIPLGTLITELLDISGNYKWFITVGGILKIVPSGSGVIKTLPMQTKDVSIGLYEIVDFKFALNDKSNLITTLEVILGTESESSYNSFEAIALDQVQLEQGWDSGFESNYITDLDNNLSLMSKGMLYGNASLSQFENVFRKFYIPGWTEGSTIDSTVPMIITCPTYSATLTQGDNGVNVSDLRIWNYEARVSSYKFDPTDGSIIFGVALLYLYNLAGSPIGSQYRKWKPRITCRFFCKQTIGVAPNPTIFSVTWVGNGGVGRTRRLNLSSLSIKQGVTWSEYIDGEKVIHEEKAHNDTVYATDRANLMLSRINDLVDLGEINLVPDAWKYFNLTIGDRINISGTMYPNIYTNNNGFPLDIEGYSFDGSSHLITLSVGHSRTFIATKNFR